MVFLYTKGNELLTCITKIGSYLIVSLLYSPLIMLSLTTINIKSSLNSYLFEFSLY